MHKNITIIGSGAYGTALANVLADNNHAVVMYGVSESQVDDINLFHKNSAFFGETKINEKIRATLDLAAALEDADYLVLGIPTVALVPTLEKIKPLLKRPVVIINTIKGIDANDLRLLSDLIIEELEPTGFLKEYCALYGPSIASEVFNRKPCYVNLVSRDEIMAKEVTKLFMTSYFFPQVSLDLAACEIAATLKNVIAIAAGIFDGLELGDNAHATLLTYGLNEMIKIAVHFGAQPESFINYATLGDLILTASSKKSRNFTFGTLIVRHQSASMASENYNLTVEGVGSSSTAYEICKKYKIKSELFETIYDIVHNDKNPRALAQLLFVLK